MRKTRASCARLDPFLAGKQLEIINRELIDRITDAKLAEGASNATVNRHLALVRTILRRCHRDWEWMDRAVAVRPLREPTRRIRFLTRDQAAALLRELPEHLRDIVTFALSHRGKTARSRAPRGGAIA